MMVAEDAVVVDGSADRLIASLCRGTVLRLALLQRLATSRVGGTACRRGPGPVWTPSSVTTPVSDEE